MPKYKAVTITAKVTKTLYVRIEDGEEEADAIELAHENFSVMPDGAPDKYDEQCDSVVDVTEAEFLVAPPSRCFQTRAHGVLAALLEHTDTDPDDWESIDGPATGVGVESWYRNVNDGREAYCCDDQGDITIDVRDADSN